MKKTMSWLMMIMLLSTLVLPAGTERIAGAEAIAKAKDDQTLLLSVPFQGDLDEKVAGKSLKAVGSHQFVAGSMPSLQAVERKGAAEKSYFHTEEAIAFGADSFSVSFWYKGDTLAKQVLLSNKDFSNGAGAGWAIYTEKDMIRMNIGFPGSKDSNISFGRNTFDASTWRYVTFVVDREQALATLYIDGYEMAQTSLRKGILTTNNPLYIGADSKGNNSNNNFQMSHLMIDQQVWSKETVAAAYKSYGRNIVDTTKLQSLVEEAARIVTLPVAAGYDASDYEYVKDMWKQAKELVTTQADALHPQETINYYERELNNALFIYQHSNKEKTPADLNIIIDSDAEITDNPDKIQSVEDGFRTELQLFPQADVMFLTGDVTGGNKVGEHVWMQEMTKVYDKLKGEGLFDQTAFYMIRGNHDLVGSEKLIPEGSAGVWNEEKQAYENHFYNSAYRVQVKGFDFVGFDGNLNNNNTVGKTKRLLEEIQGETGYDPKKPIIVTSHFPVKGTTWSSNWGTTASDTLGKYLIDQKYNQVLYLSGHTHFDPTDERNIYQGGASFYDVGSTAYSSYIDPGPYGDYIEGAYSKYEKTPRITNFMEIYGSKVIIKRYNLSTDEYVGLPLVVHLGDEADFTYSKQHIRDLIAPQFEPNSIQLNSLTNGKLKFSLKQATDNVRVLEYNVELINQSTGEVVHKFNSLSLPMDKPYAEVKHFEINNVQADTPYMLRVFTADSMYNRSSQTVNIAPKGVITAADTVQHDKLLTITMGKDGIMEEANRAVYGHDMVVHYDPAAVQFVGATSLQAGLPIIAQEQIAPGQMRVIAAKMGDEATVSRDMFQITFKAIAASTTNQQTTISFDPIAIANAAAATLQVESVAHLVTITPATSSGGNGGGHVGVYKPLAPSGLTAELLETAGIKLSWNKQTDADAFDLQVNDTLISDVTNPYVYADTASDTTYTIKVRAKTMLSQSEWSAPVIVTTDAKVVKPDPDPDPDPETGTVPGTEKGQTIFAADIIDPAKLAELLSERIKARGDVDAAVFPDTAGHWAAPVIDLFGQLQLVEGYNDGTFRPNGQITRAEFATMLFQMFALKDSGQPEDKATAAKSLLDLQGHWAKPVIEQLVQAGVVTGYPDQTFKPNQTISREEMVVILSRIIRLEQLDQDTSKGKFADVDQVSSYAKATMITAAQTGIIHGLTDGTIAPQQSATRAEALTVIYRALQLDPALKVLLVSI